MKDVDFIRDDQRMFNKLYFSNPHLITIDKKSQYFLTGHHFGNLSKFSITSKLYVQLSHPYVHSSAIGLVHCNNMMNDNLYERLVNDYI